MKDKIIYLVEDNEADIILVKESLKLIATKFDLISFSDGGAAIDQLKLLEEDPEMEVPELIILDINIPKRSGIEVLQFIKKSERLRHLPVVMMSTSQSSQDVLRSYRSGANSYVCKPLDFGEFTNSIKDIFHYWFSRSIIPSLKEK
jgi:DNA-binding response OmpR family regulator